MTKNIVYATDENYWIPLYNSIYSLLENNRSINANIYIICNEKNEMFDENIDYLHDVHGGININYITINDDLFADYPEPRHLTKGIYYRILLGTLLPEDINKVLYIDCDTLIVSSIGDLMNKELEGAMIGAVPHLELISPFEGLSIDNLWYNTGVMLINLEKWRECEIEEKCLEYIEENHNMRLPLQKILNEIIHEEGFWKTFHPKYNMMQEWIEKYDESDHELDPKIVHFTGGNKPWYYRTVRPFKQDWWDYLSKTPYHDYQPKDYNWKIIIVHHIDKKLKQYPALRDMIKPIYQYF
ncbi:hypothetical protein CHINAEXTREME_14340 [Halobiforma lacisalsi AJ5]|uniref:Glycosyl transferase family protein n=1 Tax=Natronobacterium lacisalsi AJ5 TaxID=358396 RepID=M0L0Z4_NATLA|nr:glycosyltransferase family 8 protein [Halobiforma lacisalsi]APW98880.1 hypothetical protein CHINAEXTREME_14340 [Halobiforma lacisalsi AJ5]EMA27232.1 glycosyl transferase family protein [Halobiforma lacisalsi AJ5]